MLRLSFAGARLFARCSRRFVSSSCSSSSGRLAVASRVSPHYAPSSRSVSFAARNLCRAMAPSHVHNVGEEAEILLRWDVAAEEVDALTDEVIAAAKAVHDAVAVVPLADVSFASVLKPLADSANAYAVGRNQLDFLQHVSSVRAVREASTRADKRLSLFDVEAAMRMDVHQRLAALHERLGDGDGDGDPAVTPEACRVLERFVKMGRRNGLHLPVDKQAEIKAIKEKISNLCIDFHTNLTEDNTFLEFTVEQLKGMPDDFLSSLDKAEDSRLKVTLKYPHYFPLMKKCSVEETRARMERAFTSRCIEVNTGILEELVKLRWQKSQLLSFPSHADFAVELNMAKTAASVNRFLDELAERLAPLGVAERAEMLALKRTETGAGDGDEVALHAWDLRYYATRVEEERFRLDHDALRQYFPLEVVTRGLLGIYERLLGVRFELREEGGGAAAWHEDVRLYRVTDASSQRLLGHFYLDLHPREGKYGHAACFGLQPGCLRPCGARQPAVAAMVANFSRPPSADAPALLTHSEVETYFHEFGHVMHSICAQADYSMFSGTHVERDFVEAPSQMLENWVWEAEPLALMSAHVRDGTPLPPELTSVLAASRLANVGLFTLRQVVLSKVDQVIHSGAAADTAQEYARLCSDIMGIPATPGTNMCASFGHLAGGYDAQYYGYLWSQVFSDDMFHSRFREQGIMDPAVGSDYRRLILAPGGSLDANVMLKNFLGRDPNNVAFLRSKGLAIAAVAATGDDGKSTA